MKRYLIFFASLVVLAVLVLLAFRLCGFSIYKYSPEAVSMHPTLSPGDVCLCRAIKHHEAEEIERGMIVLLNHEDYDHILTKRIIAREGDLIEIKGNKTYVNNELLEEPYVADDLTADPDTGNVDAIRIGKGEVFVMGDNRNNSLDSRYPEFGLVDINDVAGRPLMIIWSKDRSKVFRIP